MLVCEDFDLKKIPKNRGLRDVTLLNIQASSFEHVWQSFSFQNESIQREMENSRIVFKRLHNATNLYRKQRFLKNQQFAKFNFLTETF